MLNLYSEEISLRTIGMNVYYLLRKNLKETLIAQRQDLTYQSILVRNQPIARPGSFHRLSVARGHDGGSGERL